MMQKIEENLFRDIEIATKHAQETTTHPEGTINLLIVEDSPSDAELFKKVLGRSDDANRFTVVHVKRLSKAIKVIQKESFSAIILDLNLPDCHGLESIDKLRQEGISLPIIVMTGLNDEAMGLEAVRRGAQEYIVKGSINGNLLSESIKYAIERHKILLGLEKEKDHHRHLADHDHLTGLPNRKLFFYHFEQTLAQAQRGAKTLATVFLDLDDFKSINDTYGHPIADKLLKAFAGRLLRTLRSGDIVARIGGDEFVIVLYDIKKAQTAAIAAERILESLTEPYQIEKFKLTPTVSMGISIFPQDQGSIEDLVASADAAMLRAKQSGKNQYCFFSPSINVKAHEVKKLENQLIEALQKNEFEIHYQPEFSVSENKLTSVQALVRWQSPDLGLVPARNFIPFIEQSQFIHSLNAWILERAIQQTKDWHLKGHSDLNLSLNVAAASYRNNEFLRNLNEVIQKTNFDPSKLRLEVREADVLNNREKNISFLKDLMAMGVQILLDGFGTGFSSITQLEKFPVQSLKIDRSIIHKSNEPKFRGILNAIVELAHGFNLVTIGEGVETKEQFEVLKSSQCDRAQGFFLGKPVKPENLIFNFK
ncbi:MAG: EAL domain-containing protein [Deltaproteobacteria bacterium]|nr:EAL domain-containing protein [Deltaproteobacteria bacterium]